MPRANPNARRKKCNELSKSGEPCKAWAIEGSDRCRAHARLRGEMTRFPAGPQNPNYKHGRYAKVLPARLLETYEAAIADPELLAQREEIAMLTARMRDVVARVDTGESGRIWAELKAAAAEMVLAKKMNDSQGVSIAFAQILKLINAGHEDYAAWEDVRGLALDRSKLIKQEGDRIIKAKLFLTAEQGVNMLVHVANAINDTLSRHVPEKALRDVIVCEIDDTVRKLLRAEPNAES